MITPTQQKVFSFIHKQIRSTGCAPSYQEIADAVDSRSTSSIHRLIVELEQRGYLTRSRGRARGITLLRVPANPAGPAFEADALSGERPLKENPGTLLTPDDHEVFPPKPFEQKADRNSLATGVHSPGKQQLLHIEVILTLLGRSHHYTMTVEDDAMKGDGILCGDMVILRRCEQASSGDVVAVPIEGRTALRRMTNRGKRVILQASDPRQEILILPIERLKILGRMAFLIREC